MRHQRLTVWSIFRNPAIGLGFIQPVFQVSQRLCFKTCPQLIQDVSSGPRNISWDVTAFESSVHPGDLKIQPGKVVNECRGAFLPRFAGRCQAGGFCISNIASSLGRKAP